MLLAPFQPLERLGIVAVAIALLILVLVVIACLVGENCWCHRHCPCAPLYPGEELRGFDNQVIRRNKASLRNVNKERAKNSSQFTILSERCAHKEDEHEHEQSPLTKSEAMVAGHQRYESGTEVQPVFKQGPLSSRRSAKSLQVDLRWSEADRTMLLHLKTLHLTRVRRRKCVVVEIEAVVDRPPLLLGRWAWGRGEQLVASHRTGARRQTAQVSFGETFVLDWDALCGRGILRFTVHATEGATVTDAIGRAELPVGELSPSELCSIRLHLDSPPQVHKGECHVSLCYLPMAEKLSVVLTECRHLQTNGVHGEQSDVHVQLALLYKGRSIGKRKCVLRGVMRGPVVPELAVNVAHTFDLPRVQLNVVCLLLTWRGGASGSGPAPGPDSTSEPQSEDDGPDSPPIRYVNIGSVAIGADVGFLAAQAHWEEMVANPRTPSVRWHPIVL